MTGKKAIGIVSLWGVSFAFLGGLIGGILGVAAPNFYRDVFRNGHLPDFNPFQIGIGLGITQGLVAGVSIALVGLFLLAWRDMLTETARTERRSLPRSWLVLWSGVTLISVVIFSAIAFLLGEIIGQERAYQSWTNQSLQTIEKILDENEFPNIQTDISSDGLVYLIGKAKDKAMRRALRDKLALAIGAKEADRMISQVHVDP